MRRPRNAVSRETTPPDVARRVFGASLPAAVAFADLLAGPGVERGVIGPREVSRLWQRHLLNCAVISELVPPGAGLADVGSGAGLPGLVLALLRPDLQVTLIEPLLRRTTWLEGCVESLALEGVTVLRGRAEDLVGMGADVVTARAVAPLDRLVQLALPLLTPGGELLALKGRTAQSEVTAARRALERLGAERVEILTLGAEIVLPPTTVVRVVAGPVAMAGSPRSRRKTR